MKSVRIAALALLVLVMAFLAACESGGIGVGLPASGARWGSGGSGPDVFVGGGPVY
jgi:hypothetical protein